MPIPQALWYVGHMSNGPILIYDKSAMQRLKKDEARWLTHFFRCNITPVYLMEVLGDLAASPKRGSPESMVAALAAKTSALGSMPNVEHPELISMEVLGNPVEMRGVPVVGGGQRVTASNGETGVFFDERPEDRTLRRWMEQGFHDQERQHATGYRSRARSLDLEAFVRATKAVRPKGAKLAETLPDVLAAVDALIDNEATQFRTLNLALEHFDQPQRSRSHVKKQWVAYGRPPIRNFLPYTHHCLRVSMLFYMGVGLGIIPQRPTNFIDMQYLFYLPFCMIFTSADKLHHDMAPLFTNARCLYVTCDELQAGLRTLADHYERHAEELKRQGSARFARYPPLELDTVVHRLYDRTLPSWRRLASEPPVEITPELNARIMERMRPMHEAIERARRQQEGIEAPSDDWV